jgi:hypothetical protein
VTAGAGAVAVPAPRERTRTVSGTTAAEEGRRSAGYGIQSHYWAKATLDGNRLQGNARGTGSFLHARLVQSD